MNRDDTSKYEFEDRLANPPKWQINMDAIMLVMVLTPLALLILSELFA